MSRRELHRGSIQKALDDVTALNRLDRDGRRLVRITRWLSGEPRMTPLQAIRFRH